MKNKDFILTICYTFFNRSKQETLLAQMQSENKKINETFEDIDLNDMVRNLMAIYLEYLNFFTY